MTHLVEDPRTLLMGIDRKPWAWAYNFILDGTQRVALAWGRSGEEETDMAPLGLRVQAELPGSTWITGDKDEEGILLAGHVAARVIVWIWQLKDPPSEEDQRCQVDQSAREI
jgi:hypothetical protein